MKIYVMNKIIIHIVTLFLLCGGSRVVGQGNNYFLQVNKHYFSVEENIYFSMDVKSTSFLPERWPLYFILMKVEKDHQKLVSTVKIHWGGLHIQGYIPLTKDLRSGKYLLGVFSYPILNEAVPLNAVFLYVYNPNDAEEDDLVPEMNMGGNNNSDEKDNMALFSKKISLNYNITKDKSDERLVTFKGKITGGNSIISEARISVSVVDKRFYDPFQSVLGGTRSQNSLQNGPLLSPESNEDSILNESNYLHGRLLINHEPAPLKKIYFYVQKDSVLILDNYITDQEGDFRFLESPIADAYSLKLLTVPEGDKQYTFQLSDRLYVDSIYHINLREYHLENIQEFKNYASKKYLIDESYPMQLETRNEDSTIRFFMDVTPSHEIILEDYVHFSTLAEIIREIVPQVGVKYHQGGYEIRVYDARAKNYCCSENPLVIMNKEPFVDLREVMKLNTEDIYSIEVIRPIEAIRSFGDIGVNGIFKINLRQGIPVTVAQSRGKETYLIPGYQTDKKYQTPSFNNEYPDFRSFLFWEGNIETDLNGEFEFRFKSSKLSGDFVIVIKGIKKDGGRIDEEIYFNLSTIE